MQPPPALPFSVWESIGVDVSANIITPNIITRVTVTGGTGNTVIDDVENCRLFLTPEARIGRLIGDVQGLVEGDVLDSGNGNALLATLDQALTAITGDRPNAANFLNAFIHQVEGFVAGGSLTPGQGLALIDAAQFVIDQLNG